MRYLVYANIRVCVYVCSQIAMMSSYTHTSSYIWYGVIYVNKMEYFISKMYIYIIYIIIHVYTYIHIYTKQKEILSFATRWTELDGITLSEISYPETDFTPMCNLRANGERNKETNPETAPELQRTNPRFPEGRCRGTGETGRRGEQHSCRDGHRVTCRSAESLHRAPENNTVR